jgi:hypothetical protein
VLDAVLDLAGEDEAVGARTWTAASRTSSGRAQRVPGTFWACMGAPGSANAVAWRARAGYRRRPCVLGELCDMVKVRGEGQRKEWQAWPAWCTALLSLGFLHALIDGARTWLDAGVAEGGDHHELKGV